MISLNNAYQYTRGEGFFSSHAAVTVIDSPHPSSEAETSTADLGGRMALHYASSQTLDMFWPLEGVNSTTFLYWA